MNKISKVLTLTDVGKNNSHVSAIRIPVGIVGSDVLPTLPKDILNPSVTYTFYDENGHAWNFIYVYYNDKYHNKSKKQSHNEYRLSKVTSFINAYGLDAGDELWFGIDEYGKRYIGFNKKALPQPIEDGVIHIRGGWKIYEF